LSVTTEERVRRYIAKCPPAISGQHGHDATFHVARVLVHGFALNPAAALAFLQDWNKGCVPPWSDRELQHKIESALTVPHREPRGYLLGDGIRVPPPSGSGWGTGCAPVAKPLDPVAATARYLKGFRCEEMDLSEASPVRITDEPKFDGALLVDWLYAPGELVNFVTEFLEEDCSNGKTKARPYGKGLTMERDALAAAMLAKFGVVLRDGGQFVVNLGRA